MNLFYHIGRYSRLMIKTFGKPDKHRMSFKQLSCEMGKLGLGSLGIVTIISIFIGGVLALQTTHNIESPFIPRYTVGLITRDTILLEFSSTIVLLILAGKVGSNIASELGTMRVTEQIDALEIMGVNSANYLILPKILGFVLLIPFLVIFSMFVGMVGGFLAGIGTGVITRSDFLYGLTYSFNPYHVTYALIKAFVFAFIISSVSAYYGYFTMGGALDVGRSSTKAVVSSSVLILLFNYILTQLLLI